jgi:hypothetical protein
MTTQTHPESSPISETIDPVASFERVETHHKHSNFFREINRVLSGLPSVPPTRNHPTIPLILTLLTDNGLV